MKICVNHPDKKAFTICRGCGKDYCELCLDEGKEYYYCRNIECQKLLREETGADWLPETIICPNCESELELSEEERYKRKVHCRECESLIDFNFNPPKILRKDNYVELVTSLNQSDIGLITSILDDSNIDYYLFGQNFLSVDPLIQPAKFYVNENQIEEARELFKNFEFRIFGTSRSQYDGLEDE